MVSGEGDVEFGAELPAFGGVLPHGGVGAGVGGFVVGVGGDPVALFGGLGGVGGDVDGVGDALVGEGGFGGVEALLEELEVGGAGGDEGAVADDGEKFSARESATPRRLRRAMERLEWARAARMVDSWSAGSGCMGLL